MSKRKVVAAGGKKDAGVEYWVNKQGKLYYREQSDMPVQNNVAGTKGLQRKISQKTDQTVTIVYSKIGHTSVSYKIVTDSKKNPFINVTFAMDQEKDTSQELDYAIVDEEMMESVKEDEDIVSTSKEQITNKYERNAFKCPICPFSSHKRYLLLRHMNTHRKDSLYECGICERGFKTVSSLQNHVNMHTGVKPFICKHCKKSFASSGELVRHTRYIHTHERPHKCNECDYAAVERSKLRRHMRCHSGERPYQCRHCTYAATDIFKLNRHLRIHTGEKPYECEICNRRFNQANSLKYHLNVHNVTNKPVYACDLCPAKCGRKTDLRKHIQKLHTAGKFYKCRHCEKHFQDQYSLNIHIKVHKGEKRFKCDMCSYASQTRRHLLSHKRVHSEEKPFGCKDCQLCFRQKQLLRRHINIYHNPEFQRPIPKDKPYCCRLCNKKYAYKGFLVRHNLAKHKSGTKHGKKSAASEDVLPSDDKNTEEGIDHESIHVEVSVKDDIPHDNIVVMVDGKKYAVMQLLQMDDIDAGTF